MSIKQAMILAAGKGSRLAPLTNTTPKPMLPVQGKPLIQWQVEALANCGIHNLVINLHHLGDQIVDHLGDGSSYGVKITYSHEQSLLETGGGIAKALPHFRGQRFYLINGDIWSNFDFASLPQNLAPNSAHIVITPTPAYREQGDFDYAAGKITQRGGDYVYCGIALLSEQIFSNFELTAHTQAFSLRDIYFQLIEKQLLHAQVHQGNWLDIGTIEQYEAVK